MLFLLSLLFSCTYLLDTNKNLNSTTIFDATSSVSLLSRILAIFSSSGVFSSDTLSSPVVQIEDHKPRQLQQRKYSNTDKIFSLKEKLIKLDIEEEWWELEKTQDFAFNEFRSSKIYLRFADLDENSIHSCYEYKIQDPALLNKVIHYGTFCYPVIIITGIYCDAMSLLSMQSVSHIHVKYLMYICRCTQDWHLSIVCSAERSSIYYKQRNKGELHFC